MHMRDPNIRAICQECGAHENVADLADVPGFYARHERQHRLSDAMRDLARFMVWVEMEARFARAHRSFNGDYGRADALACALCDDTLRLAWPEECES